MVEYSCKCGSGLETSKKLDIILSSKLFKPTKGLNNLQNIFTYQKYYQSLEYGVMMCFDTGAVD